MSNSSAILKQLSDLSDDADDIITENVPPLSRIEEWCDIVTNAADKIIEEGTAGASSSSDFAELPTLNVFLTGKGPSRAPRVSTVLNRKAREKLHPNKERLSTLRKSSVRAPLNETITIEDTPKKTRASYSDLSQSASTSSSTVEKKVAASSKKGMTLRGESSKRKSSPKLPQNKEKKTKMAEKEKDKNIEKLPKAIRSIKSPVGSHTSVLKESRTLRSKMEINKENTGESRKKLMAPPPLSQQKKLIKRAIEEKKNQKEGVKLRSGGGPLSKKVPNKEATPKADKIHESEKTLRGPNIGPSYNPQAHSLKKVPKTVAKADKSLSDPVASTSKTAPTSYPITPPRSSFVSYDISEIKSDSEDEEESSDDKDVPSWATGVRLRKKLLQFHHEPIDTDELFGNHYEPVDLVAMMGVTKRAYKKRTSSAIWNTSIV